MRAVLDHLLRRLIVVGRLTVRWPDGKLTTYCGELGPEALIALTDTATVRRIGRNPALAIGEAYMEGTLVPVDGGIHDLLDLLLINRMAEASRHQKSTRCPAPALRPTPCGLMNGGPPISSR